MAGRLIELVGGPADGAEIEHRKAGDEWITIHGETAGEPHRRFLIYHRRAEYSARGSYLYDYIGEDEYAERGDQGSI